MSNLLADNPKTISIRLSNQCTTLPSLVQLKTPSILAVRSHLPCLHSSRNRKTNLQLRMRLVELYTLLNIPLRWRKLPDSTIELLGSETCLAIARRKPVRATSPKLSVEMGVKIAALKTLNSGCLSGCAVGGGAVFWASSDLVPYSTLAPFVLSFCLM